MTLGKWAWKLPPFKQSVTTDLTNLKVLKMDNAQVGEKAGYTQLKVPLAAHFDVRDRYYTRQRR
jgi:hypothetical protein